MTNYAKQSKLPSRAERSPVLGVEVVRNKEGWHINVSINNVPYEHYGPYKEEITFPQALHLLSTTFQLEGKLPWQP